MCTEKLTENQLSLLHVAPKNELKKKTKKSVSKSRRTGSSKVHEGSLWIPGVCGGKDLWKG